MAAVKNHDAQTAVKMIERLDPRLAPPRIAHEIGGKGGGAIPITMVVHDVSADEEDEDPE